MPHKMHHYHCSASDRLLSVDEVRTKDKEAQINIMTYWFNYHFEDPAERKPYMEDEYIYINGGPYNPYDVLGKEFDDIVPENVIHILAEELCHIQTKWAPTLDGNYYRDGKVDHPLKEFNEVMRNITTLLSANDNIPPDAVLSMRRLLYANIIIAIEVYLSDTFKNEVIFNDSVTRRFVETSSVFKENKILVSDIYKSIASIKERVDNHLKNILWHNLDKIKNIYENTFGIKFPTNTTKITQAIKVRHDIVHRNGKTKDGESHEINEKKVKDLIKEAKKFVYHIDEAMTSKILNPTTK